MNVKSVSNPTGVRYLYHIGGFASKTRAVTFYYANCVNLFLAITNFLSKWIMFHLDLEFVGGPSASRLGQARLSLQLAPACSRYRGYVPMYV